MNCLSYLSLAEANGQLLSGSKAILAKILTVDILCPNHLEARHLQNEPMLVIDGQALIISIGKPQEARPLETLQTSLLRLFSKVAHSSRNLMSCSIAIISTQSKVVPGNGVGKAQWQSEDHL